MPVHSHAQLRQAIDKHPVPAISAWRSNRPFIDEPLIFLDNLNPSVYVLNCGFNFGAGHLGNEQWHKAGIGAKIIGHNAALEVEALLKRSSDKRVDGYIRLTRYDSAVQFMSPDAPFYGVFVRELMAGAEDVFVPCEFFMYTPEDKSQKQYPRIRFPGYPTESDCDDS